MREPDPPDEDRDVPALVGRLGLPGIIDIHVHLLPARLQARVWRHFDEAGPLIGRPWPIRYRWSVPDLMAHLRVMGVRRFSTMPYAHRPGMAADLCRFSLDLAAENPDVLPTLTFYPEPDAADYVSKALADGARVGKVHLQVGDIDPREPVLDPVWALLAEAAIPVVIHAGSGPVPGRTTGPRPIAAVLERHPGLVAVIAHLGAPETSEFLDLVESRPNTYLDLTMSFTDFMNDMRPVTDAEIARLEALPDRVLFGSDFPSIPYPYAHAVRAVMDAGFGEDWLRAVFHDNAARLLRLEPPPPVTIGRARPDELSVVRDIVVDSYVGGGLVASDSPYVGELSAVEQRAAESELLVARADGAVVGTVTSCVPGTPWAEISHPGEVELRMLAVRRDARGRGIGRHLVRECLARATSSGAQAVVISTTPRMLAAHRLYEDLGFERRPDRDWSPRAGVDLWVYSWSAT